MRRLSGRVDRLAARVDSRPGADFLAYARAVIAWSGSEPDEEAALRLAQALAGTRGGTT